MFDRHRHRHNEAVSLDVRSDDGCRLWAEQSGDGPPLVLCHGGPGLWDYLDPVARLLEDHARIIRWDQRGCGRSQRRGPYRIARFVADLDAIRRRTSRSGQPLQPGHQRRGQAGTHRHRPGSTLPRARPASVDLHQSDHAGCPGEHGPAGPGLRTALLDALAALNPGRTDPADTECTVIAAAGAIDAILRATAHRPAHEHARLADGLARDLLRMLGADDNRIAALLAEPCEAR